jgi:nitrogenase molybdenum-iron protein beta chain
VNLWSVLPYQDTLWSGNLEALTNLLIGLGLQVNNIFGHAGGIQAIQQIPAAELNILVSPWVGLQTVQLLEERFDTPFLHYPVLPIGPTETGNFLRTVAERLGLSSPRVEQFISAQESRYYYYIERCADFIFESRSGMPTRFVTISDSVYALGIARFLINDLGLLPEAQFVVDDTPVAHQPAITALFQDVVEGIRTPVTFVTDGGEIGEALRKRHFHGRPFVIGSTWDRVIAREINGFPLSVSLPISDRLILSRTYVGYEGALRLAEDLYSVLLSEYQ